MQSLFGEVRISNSASYRGTLRVVHGANKGQDGHCYAHIPDTHLETKRFAKLADLKHYVESGTADVR